MFTVQQRLCRGLTLTALIVACGGGGTDPTPPPPAGGIGPAGGTVTSPDGRVTLVVPANALSTSTAIAVVTETAAPLDPRAITGSAYRVTPTGTQFAVPATLTLTYNPDLRPIGVAEADLRVHQLANGGWTPDAASTIDAAAHRATASIATGGGYGVRWLEPAGPCDDPVYREFDFWLGDWNFEVPGAPGGATNEITADANGCAVAEDFNTPTGLNGRSVSFYNLADQMWHQTYIDNAGTRIEMSGRLEGNTMLLYVSPTLRFGWTPGQDQVRYYSESSTNGGASWSVTFDSRYVRP